MFRFVALPLLLASLLGCHPQYTIIEHSDLTYPASGDKPVIVIEMINGPITITTAQCKDITGQLTKRGVGNDKEDAEKEIEAIAFESKIVDDKIVIKAIRKDGGKVWNSSGAEATLQVPATAYLELISSNGEVNVTGGNQGVKVKTSNGKVNVKNSQSTVDIITSNATVRCEGITEKAHIETSNGNIVVTGRKLTLDCKSSNGNISASGNLADGAHKVISSNGSVTMNLPPDTNIDLEASTSNGRINNDFSASRSGTGKKKDNYFQGSLGSGNANCQLYVKTSNNSINFKKEKPRKDKETVIVD